MDILTKHFDPVVSVVSLIPDFNCADQFDLAQPIGGESQFQQGAT